VLNRGAGLSPRLLEAARGAAAEEGIPLQVRAVPGETLSAADELLAVPDPETLALSIPLRYMHSPFEVASGVDIEQTALLLAALARHL
jgi:putative aminopeptidase FrvX